MSLFFFGCNNNHKINLLEESSEGNQLHLAREISVSEFFQIWVRKGIPWKANLEIIKVYNGEFHIYFYEKLNLENRIYLGNRNFERGVEKLFKVNKTELESKFWFYNDIDLIVINGINLRKKFKEKVGLSDLTNGILGYELKEKGILVTFEVNDKKYEAEYDAIEKEFR